MTYPSQVEDNSTATAPCRFCGYLFGGFYRVCPRCHFVTASEEKGGTDS
jgi:hypothetical protein